MAELECKAWHNVYRYGDAETLLCAIPKADHTVLETDGDTVVWHQDSTGLAWGERVPSAPVDLDAEHQVCC